jgi:DHA1 family bicyclomycin/chloramphenicol resistance-like MFS transporter
MLQPRSRPLLWLLAFINAIGPMSTDMYLPAWPRMVEALGTDISHVQLTLSSYMAGLAFCQLVCGPLSDRFGRKPVILGGMLIYLLATIACALATSVEQLIVLRIVQGVGACTGPTLARAIIRDTYEGTDAARAMGLMAAIMTLAPLVAPLLGGALIVHFDWPSMFVVLGIFVALATLLALLLLPETWPAEQRHRHRVTLAQSLPRRYALVLGDTGFLRFTLTAAFLNAGAMAFLSGASTILIEGYGVSTTHFGFYFAVMVLGFTTGSLSSAHIGERIGVGRVIPLSVALGIASAIGAFAVQYLVPAQYGIAGPLLFVACMALYTGAIGFSLPQATAGAMHNFAAVAGTASALWGFLLMISGAIAGAIVGWALVHSVYAVVLTMFGTAAIAGICWYLCGIATRSQPAA